ncbi:MAG: ankyrin repeat domain-containing protein, partial [Verrucomicrobiota bacterium]
YKPFREGSSEGTSSGAASTRTGAWQDVDVSIPPRDVKNFIQTVTDDVKLKLEADLVYQIVDMVKAFEQEINDSGAVQTYASFLPLLGLWMNRFFAAFQDRVNLSQQENVSLNFNVKPLTKTDLLNRGLSFELAGLIKDLVEDAWEEAGKNSKADDDNRPLNNFMASLVGVDATGEEIRLLTTSRQSSLSSQSELLRAHLKRRLLVPEGTDNQRVRFTHKAIATNWEPAQKWFARNREILSLMRNFHVSSEQLRIEKWQRSFWRVVFRRPPMLESAVRILKHKVSHWSVAGFDENSLSATERRLRSFCLQVLAAAPHGGIRVKIKGHSHFLIRFAASYNLINTLECWLKATPSLVHLRSGKEMSTPLLSASWVSPEAVAVLLKYGAKIDTPDQDGWHPIEAAIQTGNEETFSLLLAAYKRADAVIGPNGRTLLHSCADYGTTEMLCRVLQLTGNMNVSVTTSLGETALCFASRSNHVRATQLLLESGCDPMICTESGFNLLHVAVSKDHQEFVAYLLKDSFLTDESKKKLLQGRGIGSRIQPTPLVQAALYFKPRCLEELLKHCDPAENIHRKEGFHLLVAMLDAKEQAKLKAPQLDRLSTCVSLLLADGRYTLADVTRARRKAKAGNLRDIERQLDEWLARQNEFGEIDDDDLCEWLFSRRVDLAKRVLKSRPDLLSLWDKNGFQGAGRFIADAAPEVLDFALKKGYAPRHRQELFCLQAALKLFKLQQENGKKLNVELSDNLPSHFLTKQINEGKLDSVAEDLLNNLPPPGRAWTFAHSLALRDEEAVFRAVITGFQEQPLDYLQRPAYAMAPSHRREVYKAIEREHFKEKPDEIVRPPVFNIIPAYRTDLARLEAAIKILIVQRRNGLSLAVASADEKPLHPLIQRLIDGEKISYFPLLVNLLTADKGIRPLPHRLALRHEFEAYRDVITGLHEQPLDRFERPAFKLAPSQNRAMYKALEAEHFGKNL